MKWLEGSKLSRASWLAVLLACALLIPVAYSIEISFSAGDGDDSVSIDSDYDVDTGVSVSEESEASFDQPTIENKRSISGKGNIKAVQSYAGSGGYSGSSNLNAQGASGTLKSTASLSPSTLSANQAASFSGDSADVGLNLLHQADWLSMSSGMQSGSIDTNQRIWTGSAEGSQATNIFANSGYVRWAGTLGSSLIPISSEEEFSSDSPTPMTSLMIFLYNGNFDLHGEKSGKGDYHLSRTLPNSDNSQVNVNVDISNADWFSYSYDLNPDNQDASEKLTANNAKEIKASATADTNNREGDRSEVSINILDGSVDDYSNLAHADSTNAESSQKFKTASGSAIDIYSKATKGNFIHPENKMISNSATSITDGSLKGYANTDYGYTSTAHSHANKAESTQEAVLGIGHGVTFSSDALNKETEETSVSVNIEEGAVENLKQAVTAKADVVDAVQSANNAIGNFAEINSKAKIFKIIDTPKAIDGFLTSTNLRVNDGAIESFYQKGTATKSDTIVTQTAKDAYGSVTEINAHAENNFGGTWTSPEALFYLPIYDLKGNFGRESLISRYL